MATKTSTPRCETSIGGDPFEPTAASHVQGPMAHAKPYLDMLSTLPPENSTDIQVSPFTAEEQANRVDKMLYPIWMNQITQMPEVIDENGYSAYFELLMTQFGPVGDSLQRMMIEQLVMARLRLGQLHVKSAQALKINHSAEVEVYSNVINRLLVQFRQLIEKLQDYRLKLTAHADRTAHRQIK